MIDLTWFWLAVPIVCLIIAVFVFIYLIRITKDGLKEQEKKT